MSKNEEIQENHSKELALLKPIFDLEQTNQKNIMNLLGDQVFELNKAAMTKMFATKQ